jgi:cell division protein FtsB
LNVREKLLVGLLIALGVGALGLALLGDQGLREVRRLQSERNRLQSEITQLREKSRALEKTVQSLRENPEAVAARARKDLGMVRKGETVYLMPERHGKNR